MKIHSSCILCDSDKLDKLSDYQKFGLVKCRNCKLVFSEFIPSNQELQDYYDRYPYDAQTLSPITIKRYHEILDRFEPFRKTNKLLDVGCGVGFFLEVAKERGWEVYGTEYSDISINLCEAKGISMKKGVLSPENYSLDSFDVVTSFEVIEHINNHKEEIPNIVSLLRKGGLFYCTTPNFNALSRYYLKDRYNIISYPEHLTYFTPKTLGNLEQFGLKVEQIKSTGISVGRFLKSNQSQKTEAKSEQANEVPEISVDEKIRQDIEGKKYLQVAKSVADWTLNALGIGYALKGYFIKK